MRDTMAKISIEELMRDLLAHVAVVLVEPKFSENIGSAARVAMNMGISRLIVVRDEMPDPEPMRRLATHNAVHLIESMELHRHLEEALAPFSFVVAATARKGRQRRSTASPEKMVQTIIPHLKENQAALLFGPEDRGLTNEDLDHCNLFTTIPTLDFSSLNLAQSVAILTYELSRGLRDHLRGPDHADWSPRLATDKEMGSMYGHVKEMLNTIGFLQRDDRGSEYWMRTMRQFLGRLNLSSREVRNIRGFCRQLLWHEKSAGPQKK